MGTTERRNRLNRIGEEIDKEIERETPTEYELVLSWAMWCFGISRRDAREEVNAILRLKNIKIEDGLLKCRTETT